MTSPNYQLNQDKADHPKVSTGAVGISDNGNSDAGWMFRMESERLWCNQTQGETSGPDNYSRLYSSRIINNYIEFLQLTLFVPCHWLAMVQTRIWY